MRISDWSSDVCSSDLPLDHQLGAAVGIDRLCRRGLRDRNLVGGAVDGSGGREYKAADAGVATGLQQIAADRDVVGVVAQRVADRFLDQNAAGERSEEHTSELQSLMRISSAVLCLK